MIREYVAYVPFDLADDPGTTEWIATVHARRVGGKLVDWKAMTSLPDIHTGEIRYAVLIHIDVEEGL